LGAERVIISLRHPVSRVISGYQRRMETENGKPGSKSANAEFSKAFKKGGLEEYISALRLPYHAKHETALAVTYGPERQSYMLPLVGFYLGGQDLPPKVGLHVEVHFACTPTLSSDFVTAGDRWGVTNFKPMKESVQSHHKSSVSSDSTNGGSTFLSDENVAWLSAVYKKDVELYDSHCAADRGKAHTIEYKCPTGKAAPGTCVPAFGREEEAEFSAQSHVTPALLSLGMALSLRGRS
jgi:hypothetical protein